MFLIICWQRIWNIFEEIYLRNKNVFCKQKDAMLREYQSEIEKLKQMIEKGGFEGGEVVPSEVLTQLCWKTQIYWFQSASQYYKCMYPVRYLQNTNYFAEQNIKSIGFKVHHNNNCMYLQELLEAERERVRSEYEAEMVEMREK